MTRQLILGAWPTVFGAAPVTPPELQAVESVLVDVLGGAIPKALRALYSEPVTARALKWGEVGAIAEALKWRRWSPVPMADQLFERKREIAKKMGEPVWVPVAYDELAEVPERILTVEGWLSLEDEYLPRVCAGEHVNAHPEAKAALVIVARTFMLRAMRDHPTLGRTTPIKNGTTFQVFARGATEECIAAAGRTRGIVLRYGGRLIWANHVAGAPWLADGARGKDGSGTEKWITYNYGRSGADVIPTHLTLSSHPGNRGCLSQNGADWLARHGWRHDEILRFFFGEDVEMVQLGVRTGGGLALVGLAALGVFGLGATAK